MKKSRKVFWIVEILLLALLIWIFGMIWSGSKPGRKKRVVCVVNDSTAQQWSDLYEGLQLAARQHNVEFVMADTEKLKNTRDVRDVIADESTDGIDALIVEQIGMNADDILPKELGKKVPKVYLNGSETDNAKNAGISFQTEWMMKKLVKEVKKDAGNDLAGNTAGILLPNGRTPYFSDCQERMEELLKKEGVAVSWTLYTPERASDMEKMMELQEKTDFIFIFDDNTLEAAAACAKKGELNGADIYAVGSAENSIAYLDDGTIQGLLVPDIFMMGYRAMEDSVQMLDHRQVKSREEIGGRYFRRKDLFQSENNQVYLVPREQM